MWEHICNLVGPTRDNPVLDPLAVPHIDNWAHMSPFSHMKFFIPNNCCRIFIKFFLAVQYALVCLLDFGTNIEQLCFNSIVLGFLNLMSHLRECIIIPILQLSPAAVVWMGAGVWMGAVQTPAVHTPALYISYSYRVLEFELPEARAFTCPFMFQ